MGLVAQVEAPCPDKSRPRPPGPGGEDAIEEIDPPRNSEDDVKRRSCPHQVARTFARQEGCRPLQHLEHRCLPLADGKPPDRVARKARLHEPFCAFLAKIALRPPLNNPEEGAALFFPPPALFPRPLAAQRPRARAAHRGQRLPALCGLGDALVQHHRNVGAEKELDFCRPLRCQHHRRAVDVRAEERALVADAAGGGEAHDLEAAGVGQNGALPAREAVQPAEGCDPLGSRAEHEVVGVGEDHLRARGRKVAGEDALDRPRRPDRHEGRGLDRPVLECQLPAPGRAVFGQKLEGEGPVHAPRPSSLLPASASAPFSAPSFRLSPCAPSSSPARKRRVASP